MVNTSARLLALLSLLQSAPLWPGSALAERLGVSARTLRQDFVRLRELDYPVEAVRGSAGGYRLGAGAKLPPLLLDDDEAIAVALGLQAASTGPVEGIHESSARALTKLEQVLPSRLRRRMSSLLAATSQVPDDAAIPDRDPVVDPASLTALADAIRDHEWLRFTVEDAPHLVEPYRLVSWERRWHLVARDPQSGEWATFRVDKMTLKMPTRRPFSPQDFPEADMTRFVIRNVAFAGWNVHARFTVHASATEVLARINPAVGVVEPIDDTSCVLVTGADAVETMAVYIGLLGLDFSVTEPPELVAHLRTLGSRYAASTP